MAADDELGALGDGVLDVLLGLGDAAVVDERADHDALLAPVADLHRGGAAGELLDELAVDAALHVDAVRADAGLAGVAVLGGHRVVDRLL